MSETMETNQDLMDIREILKVRRTKLQDLMDKGKNPFHRVKYEVTAKSKEILTRFESMEGKDVKIAGRIMTKRGMGKASFSHIQDMEGLIQIYIKMDEVGNEIYEEFKKYDLGDIVGVEGVVFKTNKGEISVKVKEIELLSKSLLPLPEKYHGLKDVDLRYRQRYVDLIVNPHVKETFVIRSKIIRSIRNFLDNKGYIEVETPILNTIPGGASAKPFITHHNTLDIDMYLRIAPELYLKRLIVGGFDKVYEIGRLFRNEGMSIKHNPEFTTIELYEAYTDYHGMMNIAEQMIAHVAQEVLGTMKISYQGQEIDLTPSWTRLTMEESVKQYSGVDFSEIMSASEAYEIAKSKGVHCEKNMSRGEILYAMFETFVEGNLIQPTFITEYPVEVSPLAKRKPENDNLTERFEIFIFGREMGNAFSELNDPIDQKERFMEQVKKREAGDEEANMMDEDFVTALEYGLPPTGGLGLGIDRLVMLLTDSNSIRDVLLFPTMKPRDK